MAHSRCRLSPPLPVSLLHGGSHQSGGLERREVNPPFVPIQGWNFDVVERVSRPTNNILSYSFYFVKIEVRSMREVSGLAFPRLRAII